VPQKTLAPTIISAGSHEEIHDGEAQEQRKKESEQERPSAGGD
jgi:hypothetical protein